MKGLAINTTLPNGNTVLAYCVFGSDAIVLCVVRPGQYVTHDIFNNDLRSTCHGHYFDNRVDAVIDFGKRIEDRLEYTKRNTTTFEGP